jgi:hypothetical protein
MSLCICEITIIYKNVFFKDSLPHITMDVEADVTGRATVLKIPRGIPKSGRSWKTERTQRYGQVTHTFCTCSSFITLSAVVRVPILTMAKIKKVQFAQLNLSV